MFLCISAGGFMVGGVLVDVVGGGCLVMAQTTKPFGKWEDCGKFKFITATFKFYLCLPRQNQTPKSLPNLNSNLRSFSAEQSGKSCLCVFVFKDNCPFENMQVIILAC